MPASRNGLIHRSALGTSSYIHGTAIRSFGSEADQLRVVRADVAPEQQPRFSGRSAPTTRVT
jgi:hypothetical protein